MRRNPISLTGAAIATLSAFFFIFILLADWLGLHTNPYLGIVFFLVVPAVFVFGLLLVPAGHFIERRRGDKGLDPYAWPAVNLDNPRTRRVVLVVLSLTLVNLVIVSLAAYKGIEFMDSPAFCGQVCHTVMGPEYRASLDAPHARVECVQCHIGSSPSSFARAKVNGMHQVVAVMAGNYSRPVPSPVENMRPAHETCEQCHWPEKIQGEKLRFVREYASDEKNTETVTKLTVHVGGGSPRLGVTSGIHWHMNVANVVEYIATDAERQTIPYVRVQDPQGNVREYRAAGITDDQLAKGVRRRMDCIDCHNRAAHPFSGSAERAVDAAIASGELPRSLPFARRETVAALKAECKDAASADEQIAQRLFAFYATNYPDVARAHAAEIDRLVSGARRVYGRNVFPAMKVAWGTHPGNLGHTEANGCFRCHDDQHKTADGKVIRQDCDLCHTTPE
jgi:hypothetical protein